MAIVQHVPSNALPTLLTLFTLPTLLTQGQKEKLTYGQSITDKCIDWSTTEGTHIYKYTCTHFTTQLHSFTLRTPYIHTPHFDSCIERSGQVCQSQTQSREDIRQVVKRVELVKRVEQKKKKKFVPFPILCFG